MSPSKTESTEQESRNKREFERIRWEDISLYDFVQEFWGELERKRFVPGKHIEALCEHLEAVFDGRITRLLVNMPPRHAKSSIICVLFRVWTWIKRPSLQWLCSSYALRLAMRDNYRCRRIILSSKFQKHYGHLFKLKKDQNAKIRFENDQFGYSQASSVGSSATGDGGDILLIDDPHAIDDKRSELARETVHEWFKDTWCSRLNDPATTAMIVVAHRVHDDDLSGYILRGQTGEHWVHLNLATEYEPDRKCVTETENFRWEDWRELKGELLWPERFPANIVERAKKRHGTDGYSALYQQDPVPAGGGKYKKAWLRYFTETDAAYLLETANGVRSVLKQECWKFATGDVAISEKQDADYTVFCVWVVTPALDLLLIDMVRDHLSNPEQLKQMKLLRLKHGVYFVIEKVAYQSALIQQAILNGIPCKGYYPEGDKVSRSADAVIWMENEKTFLSKYAEWLQETENELLRFPKAPHDDIADNFPMAAKEISVGGVEVLDEETAEALTSYAGY